LELSVNLSGNSENNNLPTSNEWLHVYSEERATNIIKNGNAFYLRTASDVKTSNSVNGPFTSLGFAEQIGQTPSAELLGFDNLGRLNIATGWECLYKLEEGIWTPRGLCGFGTSGGCFTKLENGRIVLSKYGFLRDIYYSDDNGDNWINSTNDDVDWAHITIAANGHIFAASAIGGTSTKGVITSVDAGSSWQYINNSLETLTLKKPNEVYFELYTAYSTFDNTYDSAKVTKALTKTNALKIPVEYEGLNKSKQEIISLLNNYCNIQSEIFQQLKKTDNIKDKNYLIIQLENISKSDKYKNYKYLREIIEKYAKNTIELPLTNCIK
jgi:hypothetical protein